MKFPRIARVIPSWKNALLAVLSAILLILAFPDFEFWFLAWFALVPLLLLTRKAALMGVLRNRRFTTTTAWCVAGLVISLNITAVATAIG